MPTSRQANSNFWGTGTELTILRETLDPIEAKMFLQALGMKLYGNRFNYDNVEFRGLNLPIRLYDNENDLEILVTPYWHLISGDGRGNRI